MTLPQYFHKNLLFSLVYLIPINITLKKYGIKNIKMFKQKEWHHGFAYFTGLYKGKRTFVKVDVDFHLLKNDIIVYGMCKDILKDYLVDILTYKINGWVQFIAYEYIDSVNQLDDGRLLANMNYIDDIFKILITLAENEVIHRDIKLDNFLISNGKLKIIDFTFSNSNSVKVFKGLDSGKSKNCYILECLGVGMNPRPFVWDDFFSLVQVLENIRKKANYKCIDVLQKYIDEANFYVGRYQYKQECSSLYYSFSKALKVQIKNTIKKIYYFGYLCRTIWKRAFDLFL